MLKGPSKNDLQDIVARAEPSIETDGSRQE